MRAHWISTLFASLIVASVGTAVASEDRDIAKGGHGGHGGHHGHHGHHGGHHGDHHGHHGHHHGWGHHGWEGDGNWGGGGGWGGGWNGNGQVIEEGVVNPNPVYVVPQENTVIDYVPAGQKGSNHNWQGQNNSGYGQGQNMPNNPSHGQGQNQNQGRSVPGTKK